MKKTLLLTLIITLLIPQISMASKKRGGLSKPEYARAQAAKSSKISTPVKTTRSTASKSVSPLVGAGPLLPGQSRVGSVVQGAGPLLPGQTRMDTEVSGAGPLLPGQTRKAGSYTGGKSSSSSKKTTTPKVTTGAPTVANANQTSNIGGGTISQGKAPSTLNRIMASLGQMWANNGLNQAAPTTFLSDQQRQANINAGLGIEDAQASGWGENLSQIATPDSPTGLGPNGEQYFNNYDPAVNGPSLLASDFATPGTNFSRPGSEVAYNQGQDPRTFGYNAQNTEVAYGSQPSTRLAASRTPQRVSQPYSSDISQAYTPQYSQDVAPQEDFTPVDNGQAGTQRRFLGNGMLSNGIASNGKLDQNLDGLSYGMPASEEENLLRELLGINTAQASEMPQQTTFGQTVTPMSAFQSGFANGGLTLDQGYSMPQVLNQGMQQETAGTNQSEIPRQQVQNPGGSQGGGVAQQFSQGTTGGNPALDYQKQALKGFSAQEKAQKKALNELLKSIKNQYSTKQTEGINQLAKSKQEDLLKLSGLFSFANQDPNSEQRIQYEQRANQDYATQQSDFLAKLAAAMSGDISSAKQGYQKELAGIGQQRNAVSEKIAELLTQAQQKRGGAAPKSYGSAIDQIMATRGVDAVTARKIYDMDNGLNTSNPVATGDWQVDPEDGKMKQVYLQNGQPGFIY